MTGGENSEWICERSEWEGNPGAGVSLDVGTESWRNATGCVVAPAHCISGFIRGDRRHKPVQVNLRQRCSAGSGRAQRASALRGPGTLPPAPAHRDGGGRAGPASCSCARGIVGSWRTEPGVGGPEADGRAGRPGRCGEAGAGGTGPRLPSVTAQLRGLLRLRRTPSLTALCLPAARCAGPGDGATSPPGACAGLATPLTSPVPGRGSSPPRRRDADFRPRPAVADPGLCRSARKGPLRPEGALARPRGRPRPHIPGP